MQLMDLNDPNDKLLLYTVITLYIYYYIIEKNDCFTALSMTKCICLYEAYN